MARSGGLITEEDLAKYEAVVRKPVHGTYRGYDIFSMPPPSSGGVHVIQILNILEGFPIGELGFGSAETMHLMAEAMKRAYADRSEYLGDSDFVDVPLAGLTSKDYAGSSAPGSRRTRDALSHHQAVQSASLRERPDHAFLRRRQGGNAVSNTYTLNFSFGTGLVAEGTGILLNNEMDDFSAKPGVPNAYGLIGGDANAVEPGKRPLSSMSPTIVLKDGKSLLVTGSPGGSRIITTVLQIDHERRRPWNEHRGSECRAAHAPPVAAGRAPCRGGLQPRHDQPARSMGHTVKLQATMGSTQSIVRREDGALFGASDPRSPVALDGGAIEP